MSNLAVANEIKNQLGGNRFAVMTGAKNFAGTENSLQFRIGGGAKKKISWVRITLMPDDTYKMEFFKIVKFEAIKVAEHTDVYCDMLQEIFTQETGFYTHL